MPLMAPHSTSQNSIASDVKGSGQFTQGDRPVSLYTLERHQIQDDPQDVCREIHSRRYSRQSADTSANSALPIESLLHIHTWHTRYPTSRQKYALEFDIKYTGMTGITFNLSTLIQHRWNTSVNWSEAIGKTDLLSMYQKRETLSSTLTIACDSW